MSTSLREDLKRKRIPANKDDCRFCLHWHVGSDKCIKGKTLDLLHCCSSFDNRYIRDAMCR